MSRFNLNNTIESHRIAVISDTHGLLRPEVLNTIETCEAVFHAGDIGKPDILIRLKECCQTYAVYGNVDKTDIEEVSTELETSLYGFHIYMVHDKKNIRQDLSNIDIVIYGHSHKYDVGSEDGITYLNPGSCGPRRFRLPVTMMILTLFPSEHRIETEKIDCVSVSANNNETLYFADNNIDRLIRKIVKQIEAGVRVEDIAAQNRIDIKLAEQICRIYVTHPGVDVEGIMTRLEISGL